ncbi:Asparagine synthetase (glutamine-hydrolyzing) 1 [termite gut metagenome]|uniref:Asparagine synthetase (Glutamine-hydrolyzing) 1 n=1 Tax=termite gut metagenome TaxID=433724 RepID=A0A5J4QUH9_9ZZZZ
MNDLIIHRGPDDTGIFFETGSPSIAMGMRRLSIIDLAAGAQPMYNDDKSIVIVFNGEIYNYKTLKKELEEKGISFKTNCDTEVILKLYESQGTDSFSYLDGMYAFSIYDKRINKVILARDFFGEKPLYYHETSAHFILIIVYLEVHIFPYICPIVFQYNIYFLPDFFHNFCDFF